MGRAPFRQHLGSGDGTWIVCWQQQQTLTPASSAPAQARSAMTAGLGERLGAGDWSELQFDASVIATELVSNAVQAGCTQLTMTVQAHRSHIRLTVSDDAAGLPRLGTPGPNDLHGRGLPLVAALAAAWGVVLAAKTKTVWADLTIPPEAFAAGPVTWCNERDEAAQRLA